MNWTQSGFRKDISTIFEPSLVTTFVLDLEMALTRKEVKDKIILIDPVKAVKAEMKKLRRKADVFILMTHQGADLDYVIAEKIKKKIGTKKNK